MGRYVVLLKFTRSPKAFRHALMNTPAIVPYLVGVPNGALFFLRGGPPWWRQLHWNSPLCRTVVEAARLAGLTLRGSNVVVDPLIEEDVLWIVMSLDKKEKVRLVSRRQLWVRTAWWQ